MMEPMACSRRPSFGKKKHRLKQGNRSRTNKNTCPWYKDQGQASITCGATLIDGRISIRLVRMQPHSCSVTGTPVAKYSPCKMQDFHRALRGPFIALHFHRALSSPNSLWAHLQLDLPINGIKVIYHTFTQKSTFFNL